MQVRCLKAISDEELCSAWQRCFIDYAMSATSDQLLAMFRRRGYRPVHSFGAFDENEQLISFTLNGIGEYDDVLTVYDTSTGTDKNFRQQGLAKSVFEHSLSIFRSHGAKQYLLEVLNHNDAAISLYKKLGFSISREFFFIRQTVEVVTQRLVEKPVFHLQNISFHEIKLPEVSELQAMWDFAPSWQNSYESMQSKLQTVSSEIPLRCILLTFSIIRIVRVQEVSTLFGLSGLTETLSCWATALWSPPQETCRSWQWRGRTGVGGWAGSCCGCCWSYCGPVQLRRRQSRS